MRAAPLLRARRAASPMMPIFTPSAPLTDSGSSQGGGIMLELYCTGIVAGMLAYAVFAALADPEGARFLSIGF
jgi:hypothetical protein